MTLLFFFSRTPHADLFLEAGDVLRCLCEHLFITNKTFFELDFRDKRILCNIIFKLQLLYIKKYYDMECRIGGKAKSGDNR